MDHTIVSYAAKPEQAQSNAALVRAVFAELEQTQPAGFRYAVFKAADSDEFIHIYTGEGAAPGTLQQMASFQAFISGAQERHARAATFTEFELVGSYRMFE